MLTTLNPTADEVVDSNAIIAIRQLTKEFEAGKPVLSNINLNIERGQVVGLLGQNGTGKTTLIKCLLGLLKRSGGDCAVYGEDSWDLSAETKAKLGYVAQDFAMMPWMTVAGMANYVGAFYENWDYPYVESLIKDSGLEPDKRVGALSTGQHQKLAVIAALGHHPELLVLDEPVASLDPSARRHFLQLLVEYTEDENRTVLFSTHITSDLERIASHIVMLGKEDVIYQGELDQLKSEVKRIRIRSQSNLPPALGIADSMSQSVDGKHAVVSVTKWNADQSRSLAKELNAEVSVEDLNLEDIFLELTNKRGES